MTTETFGAARLLFSAPEGLVWSVAKGLYGDAEIAAQPWAGSALEGDERAEAFAATWAATLQDVNARDAPLWWTEPSVVEEVRDVSQEVGRDARAVLAAPGFYSREGERQWDVLTDARGATVRVAARGMGDPDSLLATALEIAAAFASGGGFHLGPVNADLPFRDSESVTLTFLGAPSGAGTLTVRSRSGGLLPQEPPLRTRARQGSGGIARRILGASGRADLLRDRPRTVAGLEGGEAVLEIEPRGERGERTHGWEYRADAPEADATPVRPRELFVTAEWTVGLGLSPEASLATWDAFLESFSPAR